MLKYLHERLAFSSLTVWWSYFLLLMSSGWEMIEQFPDVASSLGLLQYIPPDIAPKFVFCMAAITLLVRVRTIRISREEHNQRDDHERDNNDAQSTR